MQWSLLKILYSILGLSQLKIFFKRQKILVTFNHNWVITHRIPKDAEGMFLQVCVC